MARLKTFTEDSIFEAADATALQLEVPPAATTVVNSEILALSNTVNFSAASPARPLRVSRQGLVVTLSGGVTVNTAGYIQGDTLRQVALLPAEYRPAEPVSSPGVVSISAGANFQVFVSNDGSVNFLRYQGSQAAGIAVQFSMVWSVQP